MSRPQPTQRAYTLRLDGACNGDRSWREAVWKTHEAVNRGARAFGDWLLTLRGGLCHTLADSGGADARRDRRVVLALSWLSVESGAKDTSYVVASAGDPDAVRREKLANALREILLQRGVESTEADSWLVDCTPSLEARIREDAVWVNRSKLFDQATGATSTDLSRDEIWDVFKGFFGSQKAYFAGVSPDSDETSGNPRDEKGGPKDLSKKARGWLSNRFGSGTGSDFSRIGSQYQAFARWCEWKDTTGPVTVGEARGRLVDLLGSVEPPKRLAGTGGSPNHVQRVYDQIHSALEAATELPRLDYADLGKRANDIGAKKLTFVGRKKRRIWADRALADVERASGLAFRDENAQNDLINEFSVILDHAARRISMAHSWQKRAECRRREFEDDARKIANVPDPVCDWLDRFCAGRSRDTAANDAYRIRRRALDGWNDVVAEWSKPSCKSTEDRVAAARRVQAELSDAGAKFGDIQLFEALAGDEAKCVWQAAGVAEPRFLIDYAAAREAEANRRHYKVPAYRHPDALRHPVFCDFGESRWAIDFSAHRAPAALAPASAALERKRSELSKAKGALDRAKTEAKKAAANARIEKAQTALNKAEAHFAWLSQRHGLRMKLVEGATVSECDLRWRSKRLMSDMALGKHGDGGDVADVARADRLARVAAGADAEATVNVIGLLDLKQWNGRLQAPRRELERIAKLEDQAAAGDLAAHERIGRMKSRLNWLITFSARLQPVGPWIRFADSLPDGFRYDWKKKRLYHEANRKRKGRAQLQLTRLPGLRILSVDLGHRYAAACAVWQALTSDQMVHDCRAASADPPADHEFYRVLRSNGHSVVYRRIGPNVLPDGASHPAPWAKLDRQFLVKLRGEDCPARRASREELAAIERLEKEVGFNRRASRRGAELRVDALMSEAVQIARLALKRHGRRARIANRLVATAVPTVGGGSKHLDAESLIRSLVETLADWHDLAFGVQWRDLEALRLWDEHIAPMIHGVEIPKPVDGESGPAERSRRGAVESALRSVAEVLAARDRMNLHVAWAVRWRADDHLWRGRLRWLRQWLLPRSAGTEAHHVGGLSLIRIATIRSFYQLQKAHWTRPAPESMTANVPQKGDDVLRDFGRRSLSAMERMRENRVKQLASRLVEAALGVGREPGRVGKRQLRRARRPTDPACHAIVIENLTHYRPEQTRMRRENRQLMLWSAAKVKKYLAEGCELHGLHLAEVSAAFTSRQDSRTGAPGVRCTDVPVEQFLQQRWWRRLVERAAIKVSAGHGDARERLVVEWDRYLAQNPGERQTIRLPQRGGDIFVPADGDSPSKPGLQADLNAAANIGLKALLDPDWPGAWWNVPADPKTFEPWANSAAGCPLFDGVGTLTPPPDADSARPRRRRGNSSGGKADRPISLWRNLSTRPIADGQWCVYQEYENRVQYGVVQVLRAQAGLDGTSTADSLQEQVPF